MQQRNSITEFAPAFVSDIEAQISKFLKPGARAFAAFDADGTLWDTDIGEVFFHYQIKHCRLPNMPRDPWQHYIDMKVTNRIGAYYWLAQINAGQRLAQVHAWAEEAIRDFGDVPIFESSRALVKFLHSVGVEVFVVTASVKWAVEPAAALLGIDRTHVLGMATEVQDGIVTSKTIAPATYRDGKTEALLQATGGVRPIFCAGNTVGDIALLNSSQGVRLAFRTQALGDSENHLLADEILLEQEAVHQKWLKHAFRK